jgi:hypothetical protein
MCSSGDVVSRKQSCSLTANPDHTLLVTTDINKARSTDALSLGGRVGGCGSTSSEEPPLCSRGVETACHWIFTHASLVIGKKCAKFERERTSVLVWADHTEIELLRMNSSRFKIDYGGR